MIRCPFRQVGQVRPAVFNHDVMADNDAIEPRHGAVAVEAGRSFDQTVVVKGELGKRAAIRPLVEIAHQHRGQMMGCTVEPREKRAYLPPPPKPRKVKMRTDDAQRVPMDYQVSQHRSTRFERWQRNDFAMPHLDPATDEQSVAMPADALRAPSDLDGFIYPLFEQHMVGNGAHSIAKAPVCLLQRDDIGVDFAQNFQDALRITSPICADAFVDIVGRDLDRRHGQSAGPK